jgi:hypothetical protein
MMSHITTMGAGIDLSALLAALDRIEAVRQAAWIEGYRHGRADGIETGRREAEIDIAECWAQLSRRIRAAAERVTGPIREPRTLPQHDDSIWFSSQEWADLTHV